MRRFYLDDWLLTALTHMFPSIVLLSSPLDCSHVRTLLGVLLSRTFSLGPLSLSLSLSLLLLLFLKSSSPVCLPLLLLLSLLLLSLLLLSLLLLSLLLLSLLLLSLLLFATDLSLFLLSLLPLCLRLTRDRTLEAAGRGRRVQRLVAAFLFQRSCFGSRGWGRRRCNRLLAI
jgi:hypothetical protein